MNMFFLIFLKNCWSDRVEIKTCYKQYIHSYERFQILLFKVFFLYLIWKMPEKLPELWRPLGAGSYENQSAITGFYREFGLFKIEWILLL